tara:strand:+ start:304 stop:639 length:336 start_codon:yes stop_codon:yes gene_type:complete
MAKANPSDDNANSLVRFLLSALLAMKEVNPLVESYLAQLDMEDLGLEALRENVRMFGLERGVVSFYISICRFLSLLSWRLFGISSSISDLLYCRTKKRDSKAKHTRFSPSL